MKRWSLLILLAAPAESQEIVIRKASRFDTNLVSSESLDFRFHPSLGHASHSPAAVGVVDIDPLGTACILNPAAFSVPGTKWERGTGGLAYTSLFPFLNLPDLHAYVLFGGGRIGDFGVQTRMTGYAFGSGSLESSGDGNPRKLSGEEYAFSVASPAFASRYAENHFGLTAKLVSAPSLSADQGLDSQGYLVDAGYYGKIGRHLRIGFSALNLGLPVAGIRTSVYRESHANGATRALLKVGVDESFLLTPPSFHFGLGFDQSWASARLQLLRTRFSGGVARRFERKGFEGGNTEAAAALEFRILNTLAPALGWDHDGRRWSSRWALGLFLFNHLALGMSEQVSEGGFSNRQRTFSLECQSPLDWRREDWTGWFRSDS